MNLSEHIHIERSAEGDYLITWTESFSAVPVDVYASTRPDDAAGGELVHGGGEQGVRIDSLREPRRHYFYLQPADGQGLTVAERLLPLRGGTNFRDMGGYPTEDGRRVKWGRLYRSGHMSYLCDEDLAYLEGLAIGLCCDFRREDERRNEPSRLPHPTRILGLTVDPGSVSGFFARLGDDLSAEHMTKAMVGINREMVRDHQPSYRHARRATGAGRGRDADQLLGRQGSHRLWRGVDPCRTGRAARDYSARLHALGALLPDRAGAGPGAEKIR